MPTNLFKPTGPVAGQDFYGREAAIADVKARIESGQSVLILGQRRIGKTSVLKHLYGHRQPEILGAHILHDGFLGMGATVELLARSLTEQLSEKGLASPKRHRSHIVTLTAWAEHLGSRGERLAVYLNDIDDMLYAAEARADDIERMLRSLIEAGHTVICATSYVPLERRDSAQERAPLSNVLYPIVLAAFSEIEARRFLAERSSACGDELLPEEIGLVLSLAGLVPFFLQRVGWNLFANTCFVGSQKGQRLNMIISAIDEHYRSLELFVQTALDHLPPSSARCFVKAAKDGFVEDSADSRFLIARGLLDAGEDPFRSQGTMIRELVKEMVDLVETGRVEPGSRRQWLGRLAEGTIRTVIDTAIRTHMGP